MTRGAFGGEQWKRRMEVWASAGDRAAMTGPPPGGRQQGKVKACSRWGPHPCAGGEGLHTVLLGAPCPPLLGLLPRSCDSDSAMQAPAKTCFFFWEGGNSCTSFAEAFLAQAGLRVCAWLCRPLPLSEG